MEIKNLFNEPSIIAIVGDVNEAKSNTIYSIIENLRLFGTFNLYVYGLKKEIDGAINIYSVNELEQIKNSIIFLDEVMTLWDLDNKMAKRQIENTLRLIFHNNNILVISGLPENIKKFISSKITKVIYKKVTFEDFINGSSIKKNVLNYHGEERGTKVLNLDKSEAIIFDGTHYYKINIPYLPKYDTKKENPKIVKEKVKEKVNDEELEKQRQEVEEEYYE